MDGHSSLTVEEVELPHRCTSNICILNNSCQGRFMGRIKWLCQCAGGAAQEAGKCNGENVSEHHTGEELWVSFLS